MYKAYNKIFWGFMLNFIDINIGIDIAPDFIGYMLITSALYELHEQSKLREFKIAKYLSIPLIPFSFFSMFLDNTSIYMYNDIAMILITIGMIMNICLIYYSYNGSLELIEDDMIRGDVKMFRNSYVITNMLFAFVLSLYNFKESSIYTAIMFIIGGLSFILAISLLFNLRKIRNSFEPI